MSLEEDSAIISMATALPSAVKALTRDSITKELTKALGLEADKDSEDKDSGDSVRENNPNQNLSFVYFDPEEQNNHANLSFEMRNSLNLSHLDYDRKMKDV